MRDTTDKAADRSGRFSGIGTICMSKEQRRQAYVDLGNAELISDLVLWAVDDMRAIVRGVEHAGGGVASGIKAIFAKPVKH